MFAFNVYVENTLSGRDKITLITIILFALVFVNLVFPKGAGVRGGEVAAVAAVAHPLVLGQNVLLKVVLLRRHVVTVRTRVSDLLVDALSVLLHVDLCV